MCYSSCEGPVANRSASRRDHRRIGSRPYVTSGVDVVRTMYEVVEYMQRNVCGTFAVDYLKTGRRQSLNAVVNFVVNACPNFYDHSKLHFIKIRLLQNA